MRTRLGVNVDHVATIRQARGTRYPDPVTTAAMAELAGADQITVHLREDRRHIQDRDLRILKETVQTRLNLEMAATDEMVGIALALGPDSVTLVPEKREEQTTEGGLDVVAQESALRAVCDALMDADIVVSLFIDPETAQIDAASRLGVQVVEIHTGDYAEADDDETHEDELRRIERAAEHAAASGLVVAAGHGLDYVNVADIAAIPEIEELNIGHSIVARAVLVGFERAVREMKDLLGAR
ncbi:MAG: pyridoxine 5'-phosphate synthase [Deltaproteobacteria bacterium]|nr:pyridoxine 5'-phosphate synthase [Deltaproteobacteria bacterium]